jgi:hypothetical protein
MNETTPHDNFEHCDWCVMHTKPGDEPKVGPKKLSLKALRVCTCGADRAKAAWNAAVEACRISAFRRRSNWLDAGAHEDEDIPEQLYALTEDLKDLKR